MFAQMLPKIFATTATNTPFAQKPPSHPNTRPGFRYGAVGLKYRQAVLPDFKKLYSQISQTN